MGDAQNAQASTLCLGLDFYKAACIVQGKMRLVGTNTAQGQDESELLNWQLLWKAAHGTPWQMLYYWLPTKQTYR